MATSDKFVITISRQVGAGGAAIGTKLSSELNVFFADRDILRSAALKLSAAEEDLEHREESLLSFWHSLFKTLPQTDTFILPPVARALEYTDEELFNVEKNIILDIAERNSAVILGRCGNYVLRDHPKHIRIFLHADKDYRIHRIMDLYDLQHDEATEMIEKTDKQRGSYYKTFTGTDWTQATNYDLTINTGKTGPEKAVQLILAYIKQREDLGI